MQLVGSYLPPPGSQANALVSSVASAVSGNMMSPNQPCVARLCREAPSCPEKSASTCPGEAPSCPDLPLVGEKGLQCPVRCQWHPQAQEGLAACPKAGFPHLLTIPFLSLAINQALNGISTVIAGPAHGCFCLPRQGCLAW